MNAARIEAFRQSRPGSIACLMLLGLAAEAFAQADLTPKPPVPPGWKLVEGDIQLPMDWDAGGPRAQSVWTTDLWPDGVVPYEFGGNVSEANQQQALKAMAIWQGVANVWFRPRQWEDVTYYIHIQNSTENSSPVGRHWYAHDVNITDWSYEYVIAHELGHTLGFWHEQSRSDRDTYVQINLENIPDDEEHNFDKHDEAKHYGPYDFDSLMHYGGCDFSAHACNCVTTPTTWTITVLPPFATNQCLIGQVSHLSHFDALTMSFLYPQSNWRFADGNYDGDEEGTFLKPYRTFAKAATEVPAGGVLWIQPGVYPAAGTYRNRMTLRAPLANVSLK